MKKQSKKIYKDLNIKESTATENIGSHLEHLEDLEIRKINLTDIEFVRICKIRH